MIRSPGPQRSGRRRPALIGRSARVALSALAALTLTAPRAEAQGERIRPPDLSDPARRACILGLDSTTFVPAVVSLRLDVPAAARNSVLDAGAFLTEDVALKLRDLLGAPEGTLPDGATVLPWTGLWGSHRFRWFPDGRVSAEPIGSSPLGDSLAAAGSALIERAVRALVAEGARWDYELAADEFGRLSPADSGHIVTLHFAFPDATVLPRPNPLTRNASEHPQPALAPVMRHRLPRHRPVRWIPGYGMPRMRPGADGGYAEATFVLGLTLDGEGIPIRSAVDRLPRRALRPDPEHHLTVAAGGFTVEELQRSPPRPASSYERRLFVTSVRNVLRDFRFELGQIGECPLSRRVQAQFSFVYMAGTP